MFKFVRKLVVIWVGGTIAFSPAYVALLVAGAPIGLAALVGLISALAGAGGFAIAERSNSL